MSGCLQFLKCLFNDSYVESCYVVGGCIFNQESLLTNNVHLFDKYNTVLQNARYIHQDN
jgi:hypothetical protein